MNAVPRNDLARCRRLQHEAVALELQFLRIPRLVCCPVSLTIYAQHDFGLGHLHAPWSLTGAATHHDPRIMASISESISFHSSSSSLYWRFLLFQTIMCDFCSCSQELAKLPQLWVTSLDRLMNPWALRVLIESINLSNAAPDPETSLKISITRLRA